MVNGAFDLSSHPRDLAFERYDARFQLHHRQPVEILAQQRGQRIIGIGPKDVVQVHARIVDAAEGEVNKAGQ